jgi:hypothetical protein
LAPPGVYIRKAMNDRGPGTGEPDERTLRELTQLADGTLSGDRRTALEERIRSSPELAAALERQRTAVTALRGLDVPAPAGLRERIEAQRRRPSGTIRLRRFALAGGLAAAAAAAALVAVLVLPTSSGGPSVVEAAQLSDLPATEASVPVDPSNAKLLAASEEGVPFPNLAGEFGYREAGARSDELDGRGTTTVFYERAGKRIGYTIISGEAVDPPEGSAKHELNGVALSSADDGSKQIVTWLRDGRTCVLSGDGVSTEELLELASWKGEGSVPF